MSDAQIEARQRSYFGHDKRWTPEMAGLTSAGTELREPGEDEEPYRPHDVEYVATVNGLPLHDWAKTQSLGDDLPRTQGEIEFIRSVQNEGKPKKVRERHVR